MSVDFLGHESPISLQYRPRAGQWVLFNLTDPGKQVALVEQGAHAARDGRLVAIHSAGHWTASATVKRADGTVEQSPSEYVPSRLMLCDRDGNNFPIAHRKPGGHMEVVNVFFFLDSPSVRDLEPLLDLADLPPGYTPHPGWTPKP